MRFAYLDEAGTSNIRENPIVVTAGIIVHADRDWIRLEQHLHDLIQSYSKDKPIRLHATDIFSGKKEFKNVSLSEREEILMALASIPGQFGLPVFYSSVQKQGWVKGGITDSKLINLTCLIQCALQCSRTIEKYMREVADPDEVVALVYENNELSKNMIHGMHTQLRSYRNFPPTLATEYMPFRRIIESPHFQEKHGVGLLQIADLIAFVVARVLSGKAHCGDYYDKFKECVVEAAPVNARIAKS